MRTNPPPTDIQLIASDLDGTLLDESGRIPDEFWPLLAELDRRNIMFTAATGRPYATAAQLFGDWADRISFIADNGALTRSRGANILTRPVEAPEEIITTLRGLATEDHPLSILRCLRDTALVESDSPASLAEIRKFFLALTPVDDVLAHDEETLKVTVYDRAGRGTPFAEQLSEMLAPHIAVASSDHWIDITMPRVNKGTALGPLQRHLGVSREQTAVFGDYLNDVDMIEAAEHSFAMANAHPDITARARYRTSSNRDHGVISGVKWLLGLE